MCSVLADPDESRLSRDDLHGARVVQHLLGPKAHLVTGYQLCRWCGGWGAGSPVLMLVMVVWPFPTTAGSLLRHYPGEFITARLLIPLVSWAITSCQNPLGADKEWCERSRG